MLSVDQYLMKSWNGFPKAHYNHASPDWIKNTLPTC